MASLGNPRTWIPYMNSKDCSQGFCSLHCPKWCYTVYPPPSPAFEYREDDSNSSPKFSPLVIAIIGILVTAFLLVSYYAVMSKYCGRRSLRENDDDGLQENHHDIDIHEPWHYLLTSNNGLDEAVIKSIKVAKYKRGDCLVDEVTDCSVCLNEFQDGESVRLLPKCSHAFHLPCIDTWLKSHSTCPLCRAAVFALNASPAATAMVELPSRGNEASSENENVVVVVVEEEEEENIDGTICTSDSPKPPELRAFSDLGNLQGRHRVIEIRDEVYESVGRSVSMDHSLQSVGVLVADINQEQISSRVVVEGWSSEAGPSMKFHNKRKVLHCVLSPISMKRSFSSGRFPYLTRSDRGRQGILPL